VGTSDDLGGLDRVAANERHFLAGTRSRAVDAPIELECECTHGVCDERIALTRGQYEPVRSSAARYAICPHDGHVDPGVDEVVDRYTSYWVVERQSSVEVLDFYASQPGTLTSELTFRATDGRDATPPPDADPKVEA
jgi:hypothetical protein